MFRLSKLTDYGIVLLAQLARDGDSVARSARELAETVDLPVPVVSKVLKALARQGVLESQRGAKGGYTLERHPHEITVAEMIDLLEGPVAITECAAESPLCEHESQCAVRGPWQVINLVVHTALTQITLADLIDPEFSSQGKPLHLINIGGLDRANTGFEATRD